MRPGRSSATALLVAISVVRAGAAHGLPPLAIGIARRAVASARRSSLAMLARHRAGRALLALAERVLLPGLAAHHCARKAWLWSRLRTPPVMGGPVIWAGVGFDGLGRALLAEAPDATVIETDHPATLQRRRAVLGDTAVPMRAIILPGQIDDLAGLCAMRPATLVCDGVLMYLPERDVLRMLGRLAGLPSPPRLVFSALEPLQPGGAGFRRATPWVRRWLARQGEPFRWRARPERARRVLARAGYTVVAQWDGRGYGEYMIEATPAAR